MTRHHQALGARRVEAGASRAIAPTSRPPRLLVTVTEIPHCHHPNEQGR